MNWCIFLHVHNDETDALDLKQIAIEFFFVNLVDRIFLEFLHKYYQCVF